MNKLSVFLAAAFIIGCSTTDNRIVNISKAPVHIEAKDYLKVLKRWTRKAKVIRKMDTTLDVEGTLLSWEYRWAWTVKYAAEYALSEEEKKNIWMKQQSDLEEGIEFILIVASTEMDWNDLEKGTPKAVTPGMGLKGSHWRITLKVDDGPDITPVSVKNISPITRLQTMMFPDIGHFHKIYSVKFEVKHNGKEVLPSTASIIKLSFAGPLGQTKLNWNTTNSKIQK